MKIKMERMRYRINRLNEDFRQLNRLFDEMVACGNGTVHESVDGTVDESEERKQEERSVPPEPLFEERKKVKKEDDEDLTAKNAELYLFDDFQERKEAFRQALMAWRGQYSDAKLKSFFEYYTKTSFAKKSRMRFEYPGFDMSQRLGEWMDYDTIRKYTTRRRQAVADAAEQQAMKEQKQREQAAEREREWRQRRQAEAAKEEERRREVVPLPVLRAFVAEGLGNAFAMRADDIQAAILKAEEEGKALSAGLAEWAHTRGG